MSWPHAWISLPQLEQLVALYWQPLAALRMPPEQLLEKKPTPSCAPSCFVIEEWCANRLRRSLRALRCGVRFLLRMAL